MANWCSTRISMRSKDKEQVKKLYDLIEEWTSEERNHKNGFGNDWLGNVVLNAEIGTVDTNPTTDLKCRGWISDLDIDDEELVIWTETAWVPMLKMWVEVRDKYLPDADIIYEATEEGCGVFWTNDLDYGECYMVANYNLNDYVPEDKIDCLLSDYAYTEENLIRGLQRLLDTKEDDLDELLDMLSESPYDEAISIRKWEYQSVYECD